jgi:hypothetical protein
MRINRTAITATATIALAGIGAGSALAATTPSTTKAAQESAAITALAKKLNVTETALKDAIVAAAKDRVAAQLAAGTITQAQADAALARITAGGAKLGLLGGPGKGMRGGDHGARAVLGDPMAVAATFLGMTADEVHTALHEGTTLAKLAVEKGKTSAGLQAALVAAAKANLEKDTTLTAAQKTQILADLEARTKDLVENGKPAGGKGNGMGGGRHGGHGGPRGGFGAAA